MEKKILVTGATGYIGGRLVPQLLHKGHSVRVFVRDPARLKGYSWWEDVDCVRGDVLEADTLGPALEGIESTYYLIHSMYGGDDYRRRDLEAAENFGRAAAAGGVQQIIYLGGLGMPEKDLSEHLRSRQETGEKLACSGVPVTEFRAAIIVGSGSISFEMIRNLTERIPLMVCPKWVYTQVQPIAVQDVLSYLTAALEEESCLGRVIEIGGEDVMSYGDMMMGYARVRGLKRRMLPVPVLTPRLSSYWVHWTTPVPAAIVRPLVEGLRSEVVVHDTSARELFPDINPMDYGTAVRQALSELEAGSVETRWTDAMASSQRDRQPVVLSMREGMILEQRQLHTKADPEEVFSVFTRLGGSYGWLVYNWAWEIRGAMDRLVGGVGLRRGRRDELEVRTGDAVDFWRVETVEPGRLLRMHAEMKLPGEAWLQFEVRPSEGGGSQLQQTAYFAPRGLFGLFYWYLLYPIHAVIFSRLVRAVKQEAES